MDLLITSHTTDSTITLTVEGEVDVSNAKELRYRLEKAADEAPEALCVDLSEVSYIDSTGIGVLVGAAHKAQEAGYAFNVAHPQKNVARVFTLLELDEELGLISDESEE